MEEEETLLLHLQKSEPLLTMVVVSEFLGTMLFEQYWGSGYKLFEEDFEQHRCFGQAGTSEIAVGKRPNFQHHDQFVCSKDKEEKTDL